MRIDLSALTTPELDDVARQLGSGVPHEQVADFVRQRTAARLLTVASSPDLAETFAALLGRS